MPPTCDTYLTYTIQYNTTLAVLMNMSQIVGNRKITMASNAQNNCLDASVVQKNAKSLKVVYNFSP